MSSNGTSAPPETSAASCQAASSTNAASESWSARLCMPRSFAGPSGAPATGSGLAGAGSALQREELGVRRLAAAARGAEPFFAVAAHRLDDRDQRAALLGQAVLDARRHLGEGLALDHALLLQCSQPQRQRARADALQRALQLAEARAPVREVPDHQHRP